MKTKVLMASALCVGVLGMSTVTLASEITPSAGEVAGSTATTKGKVEIKEDTSAWNPNEKPPTIVDPNNPEGEGKPEDGEGETGNGTQAFHIDWISNFDFGVNTLTGKAMTAPVKGVSFYPGGDMSPSNVMPVAPFAQVTDNSGYGGWTLSVKESGFKATSDKGTQGDTGLMITVGGKSSTQTILGTKPTLTQGVKLEKDNQVEIAKIAPDANNPAAGTYTMFLDGTTLSIPSNIQVGAYEDTLTWVMTKDIK